MKIYILIMAICVQVYAQIGTSLSLDRRVDWTLAGYKKKDKFKADIVINVIEHGLIRSNYGGTPNKTIGSYNDNKIKKILNTCRQKKVIK